jgi:hypothetical protein
MVRDETDLHSWRVMRHATMFEYVLVECERVSEIQVVC